MCNFFIIFSLNLFAIDSVNTGDPVNALSDYSMSEKVVGKWVDGRNIYKRTFSHTRVSGGSAQTFHTDPNLYLIKSEFVMQSTNGYDYLPQSGSAIYQFRSTGAITFDSQSYDINATVIITLYYVKRDE